VRCIQYKLLPHPFAPLLNPLGMVAGMYHETGQNRGSQISSPGKSKRVVSQAGLSLEGYPGRGPHMAKLESQIMCVRNGVNTINV
jgi:hypothetical protein